MAKVVIQGIKLSITDTMREQAQKAMEKVFSRYDPISHRLTVREAPNGLSLKLSYKDAAGEYESSTTCRDFYAGVRELRDTMLRNIRRQHDSNISKKRKSVNPDKQEAALAAEAVSEEDGDDI